MTRRLLALLTLLAAFTLPARGAAVDEVDPFIGTAGEGNTFPGVSLPFGFIQVSPDTAGAASGAAGYKHDRLITGFSQQHISGMGGPLYGHISVLPMTGPLSQPSSLVSTGKCDEAASPGYYTVRLAPWDVQVELTATRHVALHRHRFPAHEQGRVVVDVGHVLYDTGANWGSAQPIGGEVQIDPVRREVSGHMSYQGARSSTRIWKVWFVMQLDAAFDSHGSWGDDGQLAEGSVAAVGSRIGAYLNFRTQAGGGPGQTVNSKIAVSFRSLDQARGYLTAEAPGWDFDAARKAARAEWQQALSRIEIDGGTPDQRRQFYTALYRTQLTPNDWTGESPARYGDAVYYENILCLWDTFRTVNPLLTLIQPKVQSDIVNTLLAYHRLDGWTGDAHSAHTYEHVQNGSNADVVIADAYAKRLPGIDWAAAYQAVRKNAFVDPNPAANNRPNQGRLRLNDYRRHGYLPTDVSPYPAMQSVSRTLEYVYNDASVLLLARDFGSAEDVADLRSRLTWYKNLWDPASGFMRGRSADGRWHEPFNPTQVETGKQFYEGHAWTWSWYVPHDVPGLIALHGSPEAFVNKLTTAVEQFYEAYNEPGMLQTYLFTHAGRPDLTQHHLRRALRHFNSSPAGLPGNDDSGTTSAWLVWAMLGLYPNAGQDYFYIGSPVFPRATVHLGGGRKLVIEAPATSDERRHVGQARLDGKRWPRAWLRHADLQQGARLQLQMQAAPSRWGRNEPPPLHPAMVDNAR